MSDLFEGRGSDSPYIEAVWRGRADSNYAPVCPASNRWHPALSRHQRLDEAEAVRSKDIPGRSGWTSLPSSQAITDAHQRMGCEHLFRATRLIREATL